MTRNGRSWVTAGLPAGAYDALATELPASRLWSLLLDVMEARAAARGPAGLAEPWIPRRRDRRADRGPARRARPARAARLHVPRSPALAVLLAGEARARRPHRRRAGTTADRASGSRASVLSARALSNQRAIDRW